MLFRESGLEKHEGYVIPNWIHPRVSRVLTVMERIGIYFVRYLARVEVSIDVSRAPFSEAGRGYNHIKLRVEIWPGVVKNVFGMSADEFGLSWEGLKICKPMFARTS
jgi:hypothetical protein